MSQVQRQASSQVSRSRLPLSGLLALAAAGFTTVMLETMPAGILPAISKDLGVSESAAGQTVTVFAVGSIVGAVPLVSATMGWPRRRLLLLALVGYVLTSVVTGLSDNLTLTLAVRFVTGVFGGTLWALLAGFARRMGAPGQQGRALTIVMAGTPVAFAVGTPAGTLLAELLGWRYTFAVMALLSAGVTIWIRAAVPDFPGQAKSQRTPLRRAFVIPGVAAICAVTLLFVMAHSALFTYITLFLDQGGLADNISAVLLLFGVMSMASIWVTGMFIDGHLRSLMLGSTALLALAVLSVGLLTSVSVIELISIALWGIAFGGAPSLLQSAVSTAAGPASDTVQPVVVTGWNIGIAGGGLVGGVLLDSAGASALTWGALALLVIAFVITAVGRHHAFPPHRA
ncbi:MFS transporter [Streptomyces sp. NPDC085932]|uniref:MFS transporter n=1 Tax=Streptomyces sp. NPDC085932 TaxID=3365741 RepID=UPI0037D278D2